VAGTGRRLFQAGPLTFGVVICHEGWRYPETVRWAARRGVQVVFHPHAHVAEPGRYRPATFLEPGNTFHEKAMLRRAGNKFAGRADDGRAGLHIRSVIGVCGPPEGSARMKQMRFGRPNPHFPSTAYALRWCRGLERGVIRVNEVVTT